ncbi:MAG TPA: DUF748 domain-containing protein [Candidatus Synoicihabitans sp.]|nr:DUF748 domain-containing protein [Candidatus Synoicihabitans sp.]
MPRRRRRWWIVGGVVLAIVLLIQFAASPIGERIANRKLAQLDGFTGELEELKIVPWRGVIEVHNLVLRERDHPNDVPALRIKKAALMGAFGPMLRGKLGGRAFVEGLELVIVKRTRFDGPLDAAQEAEEKLKEQREKIARAERALSESFPMELTRLEVVNSQVRFLDPTHEPRVDVGIEQFHLVLENLRNRPNEGEYPATLDLTGVTTGDGQLKIHVEADPLAQPVRLFTSLELKELALPEFNSFLLAYANADVSSGTFDLYTEVTVKDRRYDGYIKPFFQNLDFDNPTDQSKPLHERAVETIVSATSKLLKNDETEKVATQTPFSGGLENNQVGVWETVENLLRNAFVQALREGLDPTGADSDQASE